ncbi:DUF418 domain-containing protein [Nonomuraea wenchangensis]|nr:DUF418 domain-containing protein [Nonomuraea wenchangensis]
MAPVGGQWSLTCYLLQSVIFVAVFAPYFGVSAPGSATPPRPASRC